MKHTPIWTYVAAVVAIAAAIGVGFVLVGSRASGSGATLPLALVTESPSPSSSPGVKLPPPSQSWSVAKALGPVVVYAQPSGSATVRARFNKTTIHGYPSIFLVRKIRQVGGSIWYDVWLPIRPNESHGWLKEGSVALYTTASKIVIDLSQHRLTVYRRGSVMGTFPVATGTSQLPTPTGTFYVNEKLRPTTPGGPYGALALGTSAYQMKLAASAWPQGGPVGIHGTNQDYLIGKSVSHGCVRMHNADILKVSDWVPAGSPIIIRP